MQIKKQPQEIVVLNHERMKTKRAMLTPATAQDQYRIGEHWHDFDPAAWVHGQAVDEVNHFGRHRTEVGDVIIAKRIDQVVIAHVQVQAIRMADTARLTPDDIGALGYSSVQEFMADWGASVEGRVWLMDIRHLTPQAERSTVAQ